AADELRKLEVELTVIVKKVVIEVSAWAVFKLIVMIRAAEIQKLEISGFPEPIRIRLHRTESFPTCDQALWVAIRNRTHAISFGRYQEFMNRALFWEER